MKIFVYFVMQIDKMSAPVVITGIRQIKDLVLRDHPVEAMTMPVFHLIIPELSPGMISDQLLECRFPISFYLQQFLLDKSADRSFFFIGIAVVKHADFHRQVYHVLDNIFNRYAFMVFHQLLLRFDLAEQDTLHSHVRFYNERIIETRIAHFLFYFVERQVMHDVNSAGIQMWRQLVVHFFFSLTMKPTKSDRWIGCAEEPKRTAS